MVAPIGGTAGLTGTGGTAVTTTTQAASDAAFTNTYAGLPGFPNAAILASAEYKRKPLAGIGKSAAQAFRVLQLGTSIAFNSYSPNKVMVQALTNAYGTTGMLRQQMGPYGGSTTTVNGWTKQQFGGQTFVRSVGSSSSTQLSNFLAGYGDQVVIEWSQESDSVAAAVLVDGVSVGTFGSSGPQKYGQRTVFTVTAGAHVVSINPPASGHAYLEAVEIRSSMRRGVETIDATIGGSALLNAGAVGTPAGSQVAAIAVKQGAGIEAIFGRDDIDLIIMSFTVNDAGANIGDPTGADYRALLDAAAAASNRRGTSVIFLIEPAGEYALVNHGGSTGAHLRYEAIKLHQQQVAALNAHITVVDWDTATRIADIPTYAATWYTGVSAINQTAGTFTGDFVHPDGTLTNSAQKVGTSVLASALGAAPIVPTHVYQPDIEIIDLYGKANTGVLCTAPLAGASRVPIAVYRDPSATNLVSLNSSISSAGTSDANGKYLLGAPNYMAVGGTTGTLMWLVLRLGPDAGTNGGTISVAPYGSYTLRFYDLNDVEALPGVSGRQYLFPGMSTGTIFTLAMRIDQTTTGQYFSIYGRIYEACLTTNTYPTLGVAPS